jgi:hypothetical protein
MQGWTALHCGLPCYAKAISRKIGGVNAALTVTGRRVVSTETTMRIAFLTFMALAILGLAAGHLAAADQSVLLSHLVRMFG